jgi:hypothetical protein
MFKILIDHPGIRLPVFSRPFCLGGKNRLYGPPTLFSKFDLEHVKTVHDVVDSAPSENESTTTIFPPQRKKYRKSLRRLLLKRLKDLISSPTLL